MGHFFGGNFKFPPPPHRKWEKKARNESSGPSIVCWGSAATRDHSGDFGRKQLGFACLQRLGTS